MFGESNEVRRNNLFLLFFFCVFFSNTRSAQNNNCEAINKPLDPPLSEYYNERSLRYTEYEQVLKPEDFYRFNPEFSENCRFCKNINYPKIFRVDKDENSWVTAILRTDYQGLPEIGIITSMPFGKCRKLKNRNVLYAFQYLSPEKLKIVYNENGRSVQSFVECRRNPNIMWDETKYKDYRRVLFQSFFNTNYHCPLNSELFETLHDKCFHVELFRNDGLPLFKRPLSVQHCHFRDTLDYVKSGKEIELNKTIEKSKDFAAICTICLATHLIHIIDWLEYNYMMGIDHIYIYVHLGMNKTYDTRMWRMLDSYIVENKLTLLMWNFSKPDNYRYIDHSQGAAGDQTVAMTDCVSRFGWKYKWMGHFDVDEFVVPVKHDNIVQFLSQYNDKRYTRGIRIHSWIYSRFRRRNTSTIIEMYPVIDDKIRIFCFRKVFVHSNYCENVWYSGCKNTVPFNGSADSDNIIEVSTAETYLAHFFYTKFHFSNPIIDEKEFDEVKGNFWRIKDSPLLKFSEELRERVISSKKRVNFDKFGINLDDYFPNKKENQDYLLQTSGKGLRKHSCPTKISLDLNSDDWKKE